MTEFVRSRDMDWATFRELLVLSYGNLQSIRPLIHYSFLGATKARTFEFHGTRRQLDPPKWSPWGLNTMTLCTSQDGTANTMQSLHHANSLSSADYPLRLLASPRYIIDKYQTPMARAQGRSMQTTACNCVTQIWSYL